MLVADEKKQELESIYQSFLHDERVKRMKEIPMHRGSNCYIHSFKVAKLAIKRAMRHKKGNLYVILLASILHDYYLYDWRKDISKMKNHMSQHPYIAATNAINDFDIYSEVVDAIKSHMWPVNLTQFPKTKEARIVSNADKSIYLKEIICSKRYKTKRQQQYLRQIDKLFD